MLIKWFPQLLLLWRREISGALVPDLLKGELAAQINSQSAHSFGGPSVPMIPQSGERPASTTSAIITSCSTPMEVDHQNPNHQKANLKLEISPLHPDFTCSICEKGVGVKSALMQTATQGF